MEKSSIIKTVNSLSFLFFICHLDSFFEKYKDCIKSDEKIISVHSHNTKFGVAENKEEVLSAVLYPKEAEKLITLFKKEMQAADESIFSEEIYGVSVSGNDWCELYIPKSFTETIEFLETKFTEYKLQD